ncbi:hypothetical protein RCL1_002700 [Eukaryota sp. TZLM3-RCL]
MVLSMSKWPLQSVSFQSNHLDVSATAPVHDDLIIDFVQQAVNLCKPSNVVWVDGSEEQDQALKNILVENGTCIRLAARPNSFLARSDVRDVARNPNDTFICTSTAEEAGPLNKWHDPTLMREKLTNLFKDCMVGRTLYVVPFSMGPISSELSQYGIQLTDSEYVVCNMRIMARIGTKALEHLQKVDWVPCMHSIGVPLSSTSTPSSWPCNPDNRHIVHFVDRPDVSIVSYGSGYGGNALLGKKCFALRIASKRAYDNPNGTQAEHCLLLGVKNTSTGEKKFIAGAFPSACGKTNAAMLLPTIPGYETTCVGDDIIWTRVVNGELRAINPENGYFGVAPGTSYKTNPNVMDALKENCFFVNVAYDPAAGDVWWEGMTEEAPECLIDWKGQEWTRDCGRLSSHPNARYTCPANQCPIIDQDWENPEGVKIEAFMFGGRRNDTIPLVMQANSWEHGVLLAACLASESTAAQDAKTGVLARDPFAMKPFIGYHAGDYFAHWLRIGKLLGANAPKVFMVNWFQRNEQNKFIWPGFGDNIRVIDWILRQCEANAEVPTIGKTPTASELNLEGLDLVDSELQQILTINSDLWKAEVEGMKKFMTSIGKYPEAFDSILSSLEAAL